MAQQAINIGATPDDGTGDTLRDAGDKINDNFDELYGVVGQVQMVPILASGMVANTTSGAAAGTVETATNKVMYQTLDFDKDADEFAQFGMPMPESWNEGTIQAVFVWTSTGTGDCIWTIDAVAISNDDPIEAAFGTAQSVTDAVTAANDLMATAKTSAMTVGGTPATADYVAFRVSRDANNGSDNLNADAKLIAVRLYITMADYEDS